jgi:hypothetical protein
LGGFPNATATDPPATTPPTGRDTDPLERALLLAAEAGRFDVVAMLARELEARRLLGSNVVAMPSRKQGRT